MSVYIICVTLFLWVFGDNDFAVWIPNCCIYNKAFEILDITTATTTVNNKNNNDNPS